MNALLAIAVIAVSICSVNCACNTTSMTQCTTKYANDIKGHTSDMVTVCAVTKTYLTCIRGTGCTDQPSVKTVFDNAEKVINEKCGANQVQMSVLCLAFALLSMFYKY